MNTLEQIKSIEYLIGSSEVDNVKLGLTALIALWQNGEIPYKYMSLASRVLNDMKYVIDFRSSLPLSLLIFHYEIGRYRMQLEHETKNSRENVLRR